MNRASGATYAMGLDLGGGGVRCLLLDLESKATVCTRSPVAPTPAPGTGGLGYDLDLDAIEKSLARAIGQTLARAGAQPGQIRGIATASMRLGTVLLDAAGEAILAVPNRDARAVVQGLTLAAEHGEELLALSGRWPSPIFAAARLRWLRENEPAALDRAAHFFSISDWITWRLCGEAVAEPSQAAESMLFNLAERAWAWDWIDRLEIPRSLFPSLGESGRPVGSVTSEAATRFGLAPGTIVAAGGADTQCALLGSGATKPGALTVVAGTTAPAQRVLDNPVVDTEGRVWSGCHVVPGRYVLESNAGSAGTSLDWLGRVLFADAPPDVGGVAMLLADAAASEVGATGMLSTLGADLMNARHQAIPVGNLTLSHMASENDPSPRRHIARSVVEGIACGLRANIDQIESIAGARSGAVQLTGGLSQSAGFAQILSDILAAPVETSAVWETTALGAALCAAVGTEAQPDLETAATSLTAPPQAFAPHAKEAEAHADIFSRWTQLRAERAEADATAAQMLTPFSLRASSRNERPAAGKLRPRVLITSDFDAVSLERLGAVAEIEYASYRDKHRMLKDASLVEALQGVQVFITEIDLVDADAINQLPDLRVIGSCRGDAVNVDIDACTAFGIPMLRTPGRNADAVADLTVGFLLMLARKLPEASRFLYAPDVAAGDLGKVGQAYVQFRGRELWHKTIGLIGLGAVGTKVCERLRGFGVRLLIADPYVSAERAALVGARKVSLEELLQESDFVSLHAAVTPETTGMLGAKQFAAMKPEAGLVNTARAALLDEDDLLGALDRGSIAGAALDTFSVEPPGHDHPLLALPNVIATPHIGGNTYEVAAHQGEIITDELTRLLRGDTPRFIVNPEVLDGFRIDGPRRQPSAAEIARLQEGPAPAVSDLQKKAKKKAK